MIGSPPHTGFGCDVPRNLPESVCFTMYMVDEFPPTKNLPNKPFSTGDRNGKGFCFLEDAAGQQAMDVDESREAGMKYTARLHTHCVFEGTEIRETVPSHPVPQPFAVLRRGGNCVEFKGAGMMGIVFGNQVANLLGDLIDGKAQGVGAGGTPFQVWRFSTSKENFPPIGRFCCMSIPVSIRTVR